MTQQLVDALQENLHTLFDQLVKEAGGTVRVLGISERPGSLVEEQAFNARSENLETFITDIRTAMIDFIHMDNRFRPGCTVTRRMFSDFSVITGTCPTKGNFVGCYYSLIYSVSQPE